MKVTFTDSKMHMHSCHINGSTSISQMKALIVKVFSAPTGVSHMLGPLYTPTAVLYRKQILNRSTMKTSSAAQVKSPRTA